MCVCVSLINITQSFTFGSIRTFYSGVPRLSSEVYQVKLYHDKPRANSPATCLSGDVCFKRWVSAVVVMEVDIRVII